MGSSVNDGINPEDFTLHYITVDQVIRLVSQFGAGALMAKFGVESAYCNVPVHPSDLLGMKWRNQYYIDLTLPFGLHSAPFIFNAIADSVEWILVHSYQISALLHYLDDFITAGPADSMQCAHNLSTALSVCKRLGLPLHPGKCEGPATVLVVLGIKLDSVNQVACLPAGKLVTLQGLIRSWLPRKHQPPTSCCQSGLAWQNFPASHDRPLVLLPQKGSSDSPQQRVPPRLALVASVLVAVAWC